MLLATLLEKNDIRKGIYKHNVMKNKILQINSTFMRILSFGMGKQISPSYFPSSNHFANLIKSVLTIVFKLSSLLNIVSRIEQFIS